MDHAALKSAARNMANMSKIGAKPAILTRLKCQRSRGPEAQWPEENDGANDKAPQQGSLEFATGSWLSGLGTA